MDNRLTVFSKPWPELSLEALDWTSAQHAGYSWRATVEELRTRDYRKDLCLVAEYTDDATGGQHMGNAVLPNLRYDRAYISYLMSEQSASEPFMYEEWAR